MALDDLILYDEVRYNCNVVQYFISSGVAQHIMIYLLQEAQI